MKKIIKQFFTVTLSLLLCGSVFAFEREGNKESWQILQIAQYEFENNNFHEAMKLAQNAISKRKMEVEHEKQVLINNLTPYQVRKVGDFISDVIPVLEERQEYETISIINKWLDKMGVEYFHNSITELKDFISERTEYPEADFLIARIYKLEGEFDMALMYLDKARSASKLLEVPSQIYECLYMTAEIAEYKGDIPLLEKSLLLIIQYDGKYNDETLKRALIRTSKSIKEDNSSRFFDLYRLESKGTINAYFKLSKIYYDAKKYQDSYLTDIYGVLICFSHVNSILEDRDADYKYSNLAAFFTEINRYDDVKMWCTKVDFWKGLYDIYELGQKNNYARFPKDVVKVLAQYCPNEYWRSAAKELLQSE